jgi:excisionase family DNA binding protein
MTNEFMTSKLLFRVNEAAVALGRSRSRIYELINDGDLEVVKDGRSTLVTAESMHSFIGGLRAGETDATPVENHDDPVHQLPHSPTLSQRSASASRTPTDSNDGP